MLLFLLISLGLIQAYRLFAVSDCESEPASFNVSASVSEILSSGGLNTLFAAQPANGTGAADARDLGKTAFRVSSLPWNSGSKLKSGSEFRAAVKTRRLRSRSGKIPALGSESGRLLKRGYCSIAEVKELVLITKAEESRLRFREHPYVAAVLHGDRNKLAEDEVDRFRALGITHLLVISGFHIGLLYLMSQSLIRLILDSLPGLYVYYARKSILPLLASLSITAYALSLPYGLSLFRAIIAIYCLQILLGLNRSLSQLSRLLLVLLTLQIVFPLSLSEIGLQFSFMALVAILICLSEGAAQSASAVIRLRRRLYIYFRVCWMTWLFTLPVAIFYFGEISPAASLVSTLLTIPFCFLLFYPAVVLETFSSLFPQSESTNTAIYESMSSVFTSIAAAIAAALDSIELLRWKLSTEEVPVLLLGALLLIFAYCREKSGKLPARGLMLK